MTTFKAVLTVLSSMALLASLGGLAGYALGLCAPNYYRGAFPNGNAPGFNPVSIGIGQGVTQGLAGGAVVGLGVVWVLSWREIRLQRSLGAPNAGSIPTPSTSTESCLARNIAILFLLGLFAFAGWFVGAMGTETRGYHRQYLRERDALTEIFSGDRAFSNLAIHEQSDGGAWIEGTVATTEELERLRELVVQAVGRKRAREIVPGVTVRGNATQ